jgi:hypothetical protein
MESREERRARWEMECDEICRTLPPMRPEHAAHLADVIDELDLDHRSQDGQVA